MTFQVKTPVLVESIDAARRVISGVEDQSLDTKTANVMLGGARVLQGAVREDVRARLASPKINALENKKSK